MANRMTTTTSMAATMERGTTTATSVVSSSPVVGCKGYSYKWKISLVYFKSYTYTKEERYISILTKFHMRTGCDGSRAIIYTARSSEKPEMLGQHTNAHRKTLAWYRKCIQAVHKMLTGNL